MCIHKKSQANEEKKIDNAKKVQEKPNEACSRQFFFRVEEIALACNESFTFHVEIFHELVEVFMLATSFNINIHK